MSRYGYWHGRVRWLRTQRSRRFLTWLKHIRPTPRWWFRPWALPIRRVDQQGYRLYLRLERVADYLAGFRTTWRQR
jgi:hypothetical protein